MYVCSCRAVTDRDISRVVARGVCALDDVIRCTSAGSRCGECRPLLVEVIQHLRAHERVGAESAA
jgi:bacterioferritin-associated ferredoxin